MPIPLPRRLFARLIPLGVGAATLLASAEAAPPLPVIPSGTFAVTAYGAVGDGQTDNTTAIQAALNAAKAAGGGTVEFPAAPNAYLSGPLTVSGNTNVQVDVGATLQALPFSRYPNATSSPAHFITTVTNAANIAFSGGGRIDGNGDAWWSAYNAKTISNRPRLIQLNHNDRVQFLGLTLSNSPMFHIACSATNNVTIDGVTIAAPGTSPNTDAIDPAGQHYLITNSNISVGDDNIAVKASSTFCGDILVTNCAFGTGHGVSIGGQTNVGLDGMTVDHCTFNGTTTALRMKADPTQGGPVQNVTYSNLTMTNVQYPFVFYSYYDQVGSPGATSGSSQTTPAKVASWNANPPDSLKSSTIPTWKNITLTNITATGATGYSTIWGLPLANALIANVTLNNVRISGTAGLEIYNATDVQFTGSTTFTVSGGAAPVTTYNALAITKQPQSQTVAPGSSVTFSVTTAGASGINATAPRYQWQFNGSPVSDGARSDGATVSGATTATLTITNAQAAEVGAYSAQVSNALDTYDTTVTTLTAGNPAISATSDVAQLQVRAPAASSLANLSVRANAGAGDQTLIVGFVVSGYGKPVLVRGIGPYLTNFAVSGVLADPMLALYRNGAVIADNDNWGSAATGADVASATADVGTFPLPDGSKDSALVATLNDGPYSAQITGTAAATGVALAEIDDTAAGIGARLVNLSVRALAGSGDNTLIVGFTVSGSAPKKVLIRATGPALLPFGVTQVLADPQLRLINQATSASVATNDNWGSAATVPDIVAAANAVGAFPLADGSKDAAIVATLAPGAYSAVVTGAGTASGVALVEVYEAP